MNQTIYRVLHIYESDYGCEEHAEPTAAVPYTHLTLPTIA